MYICFKGIETSTTILIERSTWLQELFSYFDCLSTKGALFDTVLRALNYFPEAETEVSPLAARWKAENSFPGSPRPCIWLQNAGSALEEDVETIDRWELNCYTGLLASDILRALKKTQSFHAVYLEFNAFVALSNKPPFNLSYLKFRQQISGEWCICRRCFFCKRSLTATLWT